MTEMHERPVTRATALDDVFSFVVADDDDAVRAAIIGLLGDHAGFDLVGQAPDGLTAADICASVLPDLAVVDVMMPSGGCDAATAIHAVSPETVVCAYTARGDRRTREQLMECGVEAVFVKGRSRDLAARLYEHMQRRDSVPGT